MTQQVDPVQHAILEPALRRSNSTVLVVDDDEALRRYMARVLEDDGYRALLAEDGDEALTLYPVVTISESYPVQSSGKPFLATELVAAVSSLIHKTSPSGTVTH